MGVGRARGGSLLGWDWACHVRHARILRDAKMTIAVAVYPQRCCSAFQEVCERISYREMLSLLMLAKLALRIETLHRCFAGGISATETLLLRLWIDFDLLLLRCLPWLLLLLLL